MAADTETAGNGRGTRNQLLDAAERLFSEKGYAAVGIREIVEHAGANVAAIKYHFGSKSELYLETVRRAMQRRETASAWAMLEPAPTTRQAAATALVRFIDRFMRSLLLPENGDAATCLILREAAEPDEAIDSVVRDFIQPHESMLVGVVAVLRPDADRRELSLLAQSILGQMLHYRVFRPFLERMATGGLRDEAAVDGIASHVARFSLRSLGCPARMIERAFQDAGRTLT